MSQKAGVTNDRWGYGAVVADYDNDGWPDLYVSNYGKNRLYHNNHDGTFTDVAEKAGVAIGTWSTGATLWRLRRRREAGSFRRGLSAFRHRASAGGRSEDWRQRYCSYHDTTVMCGPSGLQGELNHLFHNNGDGTFTDVSQKAGVAGTARYYGLGALFVDVNNDGKLDLVVANDSTPNYLYINKGDGTFEDQSYDAGWR